MTMLQWMVHVGFRQVCVCVRAHVQIKKSDEYNISLLNLALCEQHTASQLYNFINIVVYFLCTVLSSSVYRRETESLALVCKCSVLSNQRIKCIALPLLAACFNATPLDQICGGQSGTVAGFSPSTTVSPINQHSIRALHIYKSSPEACYRLYQPAPSHLSPHHFRFNDS
jgi:hypothetical protein